MATAVVTKEANKKNTNPRKYNTVLVLGGVLLLVFAIMFGIAYYMVGKNTGNLAVSYKEQIDSIPFLRNALPRPVDPYDPKYLTSRQIRLKYDELRKERLQLANQLEDVNRKTEELKKQLDEGKTLIEDAKILKTQKESLERKIAEMENVLKNERAKYAQTLATKDTKGYKEFYDKLDEQSAKEIYEQVVRKIKNDQERAKFVKTYELMEPSSAAKIFETMGNKKIEIICGILEEMNKESAASIIQEMQPEFAAIITEYLEKNISERR
mgnify:CR=1 FL=1